MVEELKALEEELRQNPDSRRFADLAREYQRAGRLEDARSVLEKGIDKYPNHWQGRMLLAQIYMAQGQLERASDMAEKILLAMPDHVGANHLAADVYYALDNRDLALKHYKIVAVLEPERQGVSSRVEELSKALEETGPAEIFERDAEAADLLSEQEPAGFDQAFQSVSPPLEEEPESAPEPDAEEVSHRAEDAGVHSPEAGPAGLSEGSPGPREEEDYQASTDWDPSGAETVRLEATDLSIPSAGPAEALRGEDAGQEERSLEESGDVHEGFLGEPEPEAPSKGPGMDTATLAELYASQGFPEKAIEVYQRILLADPERADIRERIQAHMKRLSGELPDSGDVAEEDVKKAIRQQRVQALESWLRKLKEEEHV
ncbi:MAG: tetratricopeptide repeat protein [Acidobacteriota bacterium]|jgi:tetratricopeptide (TPR) repeat protein